MLEKCMHMSSVTFLFEALMILTVMMFFTLCPSWYRGRVTFQASLFGSISAVLEKKKKKKITS